jgi:GT2 family glycosyltransferase
MLLFMNDLPLPGMTMSPLFSVIIPTYQRLGLLSACLERLKPGTQTLDSLSYEVIVTDDGQSILAEGLIAECYPWVRWVLGPRRGPAANRNNGARIARGEWLVFVDDDCLPDTGWLKEFRHACEQQPDIDVFEGQTYADREKRSLAEESPINESGGCLWSCNMMLRSQVFAEMNGFDERFPFAAMEDVEFRQRLQRQGLQSQFVAAAAVCHPWRMTQGWISLRRHQFSTALYLALYPDASQQINSIFYLRALLRLLLNQTLPGLVRYRGAGLQHEMRSYWICLEMVWILSQTSDRNGYIKLVEKLAPRMSLPGSYKLPQWSAGA